MPASVNGFTKAVALKRPPWLSLINRGGYFEATASDNILTEAVTLGQPPQLIDINRDGRSRLATSVNY